MEMVTRPFGKSTPDQPRLVCRVVIHDQVHVQVLGNHGVDLVYKVSKLYRAVTLMTGSNDGFGSPNFEACLRDYASRHVNINGRLLISGRRNDHQAPSFLAVPEKDYCSLRRCNESGAAVKSDAAKGRRKG
jgi:hypothetical protein